MPPKKRSAAAIAKAKAKKYRESQNRLSEEQLAQSRAQKAHRESQRRVNLSEKQAAEVRAQDAQQKLQRRVNLSKEQSAQVRAHHAQQESEKRANLSEEQSAQIRVQDAQQHSQRRSMKTSEERTQRNAAARAATEKRVERIRNATFNIARCNKVDGVDVVLHDLGPMTCKCKSCGSLNFNCEMPQYGKKSERELLTYCCHKGKVELERIVVPNLIKDLMHKNAQETVEIAKNNATRRKNFMDHIRNFNSALAFASMGGNFKHPHSDSNNKGTLCFKVQGIVYHRTSVGAHPADGKAPVYSQLYMLDTGLLAADQRMENPLNEKCHKEIMTDLSVWMAQNNMLAESYKMMRQLEKELEQSGSTIPELILSFSDHPQNDPRRYNLPTANEIAVVFEANANGDPPFDRDLRVYNRKTNETTQLSILDRKCDPMVYPLLFPYGKGGWHPDLKDSNNKRVSQMMYYGHLLAVRDDFNHFISAGKLTQQFIVDAYCKTEANRLHWIEMNQPKLRVEKYSGLMDQLHQVENQTGFELGRTLILPSSFQGGPRSQLQNFQDAMAIVRKFGKPDIFITMTCNPKWKEITDNLNGCSAENRPDLISKVFNSKVKELLHDITTKDVFGRVIAYVYVIEFQKRGLPHLHMLLMLHNEDKPRTHEIIDTIVWAEIPKPGNKADGGDDELFKIVTANMIHGPCGYKCMKEGKCSKLFPKKFETITRTNDNGYPSYQRNDKDKYTVNGRNLNNSWVVPYNPWLLKKFNYHINVEICGSVQSVKYLFKYVYKGHDAASFKVHDNNQPLTFNHDEVKDYLDSRYVSAPEAMWRLNGYLMHDKSHHIIRLAVHLPNCQNVCFQTGNEEAALERAANKETTLTAWFNLNQSDPNARQYLYTDIPYHYTFHQKPGVPYYWAPRLAGANKTISRMYGVQFSDGERFYLRMLLLHIIGAQSWKDLYTDHYGEICPTFKENCRRRHLLEDDLEWDNTLTEASFTTFPKQMRLLFAWICAFGNPQDAGKLFASHKLALTEDFVHANLSDPESRALHDILDTVRLHGVDWSGLNLPTPNDIIDVVIPEYDSEAQMGKGVSLISMLNNEQRIAFEMVMKAVNDPNEKFRSFFVDGPAGSGKTFLYNTLLCVLRGRNEVVLPVASTGIAATLLEGGRTYHSQFKVPVPLKMDSVSYMKQTSPEAAVIRSSKLIVWDEAGSTPGNALRVIDKLFKEVQKSNDIANVYRDFGNMPILFGGDFRQTLPIVPGGNRVQIVEETMKRSSLWRKVTQIKLAVNMRAANDDAYAAWLLSLGNGTLSNDENLGENTIEIPKQCVSKNSLADEIFPPSFTAIEAEQFALTAILCPINEDTFDFNKKVLLRLNGPEKVYKSVDSIETDDPEERMHFPVEFLNTLNVSGMPVHNLTLKVGAVIMLLRNLCWKRDLCNGTRLIITELKTNVIFAKVISDGKSKGDTVMIPRMALTPSETPFPFVLKRKQFPIRVAYAMTINKSQGQTLDKVGLYLSQPVFAHGQLYTAFSRVKTFEAIKVQVKDTELQGKLIPESDRVFTQNVVYKEVL